MHPEIPKSKLIGMPMIGYGTSRLSPEEAGLKFLQAIEAGYTHFDFARRYNNEREIGEVIGRISNRNDLFLTSKLWSSDFSSDRVLPAFNLTLKNLQLDYLDLYLVHTPFRVTENDHPLYYTKEWILETWREMVKLKESGRAKYIGVSNFTTVKLGWLLEEGEKPDNNQVELHPYLPQNKLINFCNQNRIEISGYCSLGAAGTKIPLHAETARSEVPELMKDPLINEISQKHKATPAQVLLRWGIERGYPVLVKTSSKERMKENLHSLSITLSNEEVNCINSIPEKYRYMTLEEFYFPHHTPKEFWDGEYFN